MDQIESGSGVLENMELFEVVQPHLANDFVCIVPTRVFLVFQVQI